MPRHATGDEESHSCIGGYQILSNLSQEVLNTANASPGERPARRKAHVIVK